MNTIFGLDASEVDGLLRTITLPETAAMDASRREQFALAAWTGITEPGDAIANQVIGVLGAADALDLLIDKPGALRVYDVLQREVAGDQEFIPLLEVEQAVARWTPRINSNMALQAIRVAARIGATLLTPGDSIWPARFDDLGLRKPIAIWVRGNLATLNLLNGDSVGVVGARANTGYGEHITVEMTSGLVDRSYCIVSGGAYGIDAAAHRAALASRGSTVAFLAGGVDRFSPTGNETIFTRIVETGLIASELPPGTPPTKWRFLQRNRLIAAASSGTVVVEAGSRSGSLNTAGHAVNLGRPLMAVPGPITSAASAGCHRLIRDFDARLVTNAQEVVEYIGGREESTRESFMNTITD